MSYSKSIGTYPSADGETEIHYYRYLPEGNPTAILQISHGMGEYLERYEREGFISAMTEHGFVVCGNDHMGHGGSVRDETLHGHITDFRYVTEDMHSLNTVMRKTYPRLPYVLLGHGGGELLVRSYATAYSDVDGVILCGVVDIDRPMGVPKLLSFLLSALRGKTYRSAWLHSRIISGYNKTFSSEKDCESYVSARHSVREERRSDSRLCFPLTMCAYRELLRLSASVGSDGWAAEVPQSLPVLLLSGESDPVGCFGKGIMDTYTYLEDRELTELRRKQYPSGRHELLNDDCRETVFADIAAWIEEVAEGVVSCRSLDVFPFGRPV